MNLAFRLALTVIFVWMMGRTNFVFGAPLVACPEVFSIVDSEDAGSFFQSIHDGGAGSIDCRYPQAIDALINDLASPTPKNREIAIHSIKRHLAEILAFNQISPIHYKKMVDILQKLAQNQDPLSTEVYRALR